MTDNGMRIDRSPFIIKGRDDHVDHLMGNLREADRMESLATTGSMEPDEMLFRSWKNSHYRWAIIWKREVIGLFGVAPMAPSSSIGILWMMGSDRISEIKVSMVKLGRKFINIMLSHYPILCNYVDVKNELSVRWLRHMGFKMSDKPVAYGDFGMPFYYFEIRRK